MGSDNETQLVRAMEKLATHPQLRQKMALAARQYMENKSFETAFIRSWEFYKEIRKSKTANPRTRTESAGPGVAKSAQKFSKAG